MYIPDFNEIIETVDCLAENNEVLSLFPNSFRNGRLMSNSDPFFERIFANVSDYGCFDGVILGSVGETNYSEKEREHLGLVILDLGLGVNYLSPFVTDCRSENILVDSSKGVKTSLSSFDEVEGLLNVICEIDKYQREVVGSLSKRVLEGTLGFFGQEVEDMELDGLYQMVDLKLSRFKI